MLEVSTSFAIVAVSLFTREWIEITECFKRCIKQNRLPLYEGVD